MEFLVDFMYQFAEENNWEDEHTPEQLRSFFTTWTFCYGRDESANFRRLL